MLKDNTDFNIGLLIHSNDNTITENTIEFGGDGIWLYNSHYNTISRNSIYNNLEGIKVEDSDKNSITFNIINNNDIGIYLFENSKCNTVSNNSFSSNGEDIQDNQIQGDCSNTNPFPLVIGMILGVVSIIIISGMLLLRRRSSRDRAISDDEAIKEPVPILRRYRITFLVVLMSSFLIFNILRYFIPDNESYFLTSPDLSLIAVLGEVSRFANSILLFLGAHVLEKHERDYKKVQLLKKVSLASCLIYILQLPLFGLFYLASIIPIMGLVLSFSFYLIWLFNLLGLQVIIAISFLWVGIKNRANYGNYLISGAIMYLIYSVLSVILWPIVQGSAFSLGPMYSDPYEVITAIAIVISYSVIAPFIISLYSIYFLFFSLRIKNRYLMVWCILGLIIPYFSIYEVLRYTFQVDIFIILLMLVIIIPSLVGILMSMRFFELGKYFRKGMRVFISHSVDDFKKYRIDEIAKYLESKKDIGRVFFCEVDLSGNIDDWMQKIVPRCHLLVFISTEESMSSQDCKAEIDLARTNNLQIIPILGVALAWDDLEELQLHREFGTLFEPMQFEKFCNELYENIMKFKKALQSEIPEKKKKRRFNRVKVKKK